MKRGDVEALVTSYRKCHRPSMLGILTTMCHVRGQPVPFVQRAVVQCLLQAYPDALPVLLGAHPRLHIRWGAAAAPVLDDAGGPADEPRDEGCAPLGAAAGQQLLPGLVRTLELFAALSMGRNPMAGAELAQPRWNISRGLMCALVRDCRSLRWPRRPPCLVPASPISRPHIS